MVSVSTSKSLYCGALVASLVVACGKTKTETEYVEKPQTTNPQSQNPQGPTAGSPTDPAKTSDAIGVEIKNFAQVNSQALAQGAQLEFGLKNAGAQVSGVKFMCALDLANSVGSSAAQECSSPYTVRAQANGQYTFTVYSVHTSSGVKSNSSQVTFTINNGGARQKVGGLFDVTMPAGFHKVYWSSPYAAAGSTTIQTLDRNSDLAALKASVCHFLPPQQSQPLNYCEWTLESAEPFSQVISNNSLKIASDSTLIPTVVQPQNGEVRAFSINVYPDRMPVPIPAPNSLPPNRLIDNTCGQRNVTPIAEYTVIFQNPGVVRPLLGCQIQRPEDSKYYIFVATNFGQLMPATQTPMNGPFSIFRGPGPQAPMQFLTTAEMMVEVGPFPGEIALSGQPIEDARDFIQAFVNYAPNARN